MFYKKSLFEKSDKQHRLLCKLWPTTLRLPVIDIEGLLETKSLAKDTVYIENCETIPFMLQETFSNRSFVFFETRNLFYRWISALKPQKKGNNKKLDKVWREFQSVHKQRELEGIPMFKFDNEELNILSNQIGALQKINEQEEQIIPIHGGLEKIPKDLLDILSLLYYSAKKRVSQTNKLFSEMMEEVINDYLTLTSLIGGNKEFVLQNENIGSSKLGRAKLIIVLPIFTTELNSFSLRLKFQESISHVCKDYGSHLSADGNLSIIVPDKKYYPEIVYKEAEKNNWLIDSFKDIQSLEGSFLMFDYVKCNKNPISGSLKRLQRVNQLDLEKEIVKDVKRYLKRKNIGSIKDIRKYLILDSPFGIPQQPLEGMLKEYFPFHKNLFYNGVPISLENKKNLRIEKDIIGELCCRYLLKEKKFTSYEDLSSYLQNLSFGALYDVPYYYIFKKYCLEAGFKTPGEYFVNKFTEPGVLRNILSTNGEFFEPLNSKIVGTYAWPMEQCLENFKCLILTNRSKNMFELERNISMQFNKFLHKFDIPMEKKKDLLSFLEPKEKTIESIIV